MTAKPLIDLTGQTIGAWTVLFEAPRDLKHRMWQCRCACGTERVLLMKSLRGGFTKSCGCLKRWQPGMEAAQRARIEHGHSWTEEQASYALGLLQENASLTHREIAAAIEAKFGRLFSGQSVGQMLKRHGALQFKNVMPSSLRLSMAQPSYHAENIEPGDGRTKWAGGNVLSHHSPTGCAAWMCAS